MKKKERGNSLKNIVAWSCVTFKAVSRVISVKGIVTKWNFHVLQFPCLCSPTHPWSTKWNSMEERTRHQACSFYQAEIWNLTTINRILRKEKSANDM